MKNTIPAAALRREFESKASMAMKTRVITSAVGLVVLFAVMALFDTFVFNVVIAAICLLAIHEVFKAFRFEKAAYIYWGFVPYTLLVMFSDFHMVRICMLPASYIFALYLVLCVIGNSKSINYAKLGGMVLFSCIIMFCFYSLIYLKQLLPRATYGYDALYFIFLILGFAWGGACYTALHGQLVGVPLDTLGWRYYVVVVLLGGFGSLLGIVGDLFASVIKRQCGIKDYGTIFPGHGGIMDRFDSVLFIAPFVAMVVTAVFYYFTK